MHYPNARLARNWYKAKKQIFQLIFDTCHIDVIAAGAFDTRAFWSLDTLGFIKCTPFEYKSAFLVGLQSVRLLAFQDTHINNIDEDFLLPIRETLKIFIAENFSNYLNFDSAFGSHKCIRMEELSFVESAHIRTLSYSNFTGLSTIKVLSLENSAVELIEDGAFDYISVTLEKLNLSGNRLKTLPVGIFKVLFEAKCHTDYGPRVSLTNNVWSCGCELIEVLNMVPLYRRDWRRFTELSTVCPAVTKDTIAMNCASLQVIDYRRFDANNTFYAAHAKFTLKLDKYRRTVILNSTIPRKIRLWTADHDTEMQLTGKNPKCPKYDWLMAYSKCIGVSQGSIQTPVHKFVGPHLQFKTICINYIATDEILSFWPLNCITYHKFNPDETDFWFFRTVLIAVCCTISGLLTGILLTILYMRVQSNRKECGTAADVRISEKNSVWRNRRISHQQFIQCKNMPVKEMNARDGDEPNYRYNRVRKDLHGYIIFDDEYDAEFRIEENHLELIRNSEGSGSQYSITRL